jgi:mRNA-degrading endonuclease toxin of MazEF toxin-antitoxin module
MEKDFDGWNITKKSLNAGGRSRFCHVREIVWCALGVNIGAEQDGTGKEFDRPVVVIRTFSRDVFLGVALTGKRREGKYYFPIGIVENREASAILSQIRLIDMRRVSNRIGIVDPEIFEKLKSALYRTLFE